MKNPAPNDPPPFLPALFCFFVRSQLGQKAESLHCLHCARRIEAGFYLFSKDNYRIRSWNNIGESLYKALLYLKQVLRGVLGELAVIWTDNHKYIWTAKRTKSSKKQLCMSR